MYIGIHVKYSLFLSDFNEAWKFSTEFRKIPKCEMSWKCCQCTPYFAWTLVPEYSCNICLQVYHWLARHTTLGNLLCSLWRHSQQCGFWVYILI